MSPMSAPGARSRRTWPIELRALNAPVRDDLSKTTTAEERLAMVWPLTVEGWSLAGEPIPGYSRRHTPVSFRRRALAR
jgi:hypothetical protein